MTEHQTQCQIAQYAAWRRLTLFAIPNGGSRHPAVAAKLKAEGVMAGVADLCLMLPDGKTVWIEVKREKPKGRLNEAQKAFQAKCDALGHKYHIVYNLDDFIKLLSNIC